MLQKIESFIMEALNVGITNFFLNKNNFMKVVITGVTGMVGKAVLLECIDSSEVSEIVLINCTPLKISHLKVREIILKDWFNLSSIEEQLMGVDACFFV